MHKIKILLILLIIPGFAFSQQFNNYSATFTTTVESDGSIIASIKGDIGSAPKFENLSKLLTEFSEHINKKLLESNYVIEYESESANILNNELEIKLKIIKVGSGRIRHDYRYVWTRFSAIFVANNMSRNISNWSGPKNINKKYAIDDGERQSMFYIKDPEDRKIQNELIERMLINFESNTTSKLDPKNPNNEYSIVIFGTYVRPKDISIDFPIEKLKIYTKIEINNLFTIFGMKDILPNIDENKFLAEQKSVDLENEKNSKNSIASTQKNTQNYNNTTSNSTSDKKPNVYDAILKDFSTSDKAYLEKIKTMDSDPMHKTGNLCGYGYSNCKYCGKSYRYEKTYNSNIHDIKFMFSDLGKVAIDGQLMFTVALSPNAFAGIIKNYSKELKTTINQIRSGGIYYCAGKPSGFCSRKCQLEYR